MTQRLDENLRVAGIVLRKLQDESLRWTELTKLILRGSPTPWKARLILNWLLERGYIERPSRGAYRITEKGRYLLKTL